MKTLNLVCHAGAKKVAREQVDAVETPVGTDTWKPISHGSFINGVVASMQDAGLRVVSEVHALGKEGKRYFGMFQMQNGHSHDDYSLVVGMRNSHDKMLPAGLVVGSGVFVCDNLAFSGEIKVGRKHTVNIVRDLPGMISGAVARIADLRTRMDTRIDTYKRIGMTDTEAHDFMVRSLDADVIKTTYLPDVVKEWRNPSHPEFATERNAWRLFNGYTEAMKQAPVFDRPRATIALHQMMDSFCGIAGN